MPIDDYFKMQKLKKPMPIGKDVFSNMGKAYYVDKTLLVKDIIENETDVILFTRPRRFGKTLAMTMLQTFFEIPTDVGRLTDEDTSKYFRHLKIWQAGEKYQKEQGKYPVIFLSFKGIKDLTFENNIKAMRLNIQMEFSRHSYLAESKFLDKDEKKLFSSIKSGKASDADFGISLQCLTRFLYKHHNQKAIVLIDEYDKPIQTAWESNSKDFYEKMIVFMRALLVNVFKTNPYLYKGILTGITRVSKESIFSGLNNVSVNTVFNNAFSEHFGLTQSEVDEMLKFYGIEDKREEVREWYDGYTFGDTEIYNPWSLISYVDNYCIPQPYWVSTSGNALAVETIYNLGSKDATELETILDGKTITKQIETNIIYPDIKRKKNLAYSLLLQAGYLKSIRTEILDGDTFCTLKIPNKELEKIFFSEIIERSIGNDDAAEDAKALRRAILRGDIETLREMLQKYLMNCGSHFDFTREKDYHNFMLGLFAAITGGYTRSNRESGEGRFDILLFPKPDGRFSLPGIIFELKHYKASPAIRKNKKKLDTMLLKHAKNALEQIEKKKYASEFEQIGITDIIRYGVAFCGKKAKVIRYGE